MDSEHRRSFRLLFLCLVCTGMGQAMLFAILPPAARKIGLSPFQVSTIFVSSATVWVFVSPMWGRWSDVVGRRLVILIGLLGFGLSMALLAATIGLALSGWLWPVAVWPALVASRVVFAVLGSGTGPASQAYVADRTTFAERTAGVALVSAAFGFGQTVGPALGAGLTFLGLLAPIYFSAALAVVSAIVIGFYLPEAQRPQPDAESAVRLSFLDPRLLPFLFIDALVQAVRATSSITLAFFLQDTLGLNARETGQLAGIGFMALAVTGLLAQVVVVRRMQPQPRTLIRIGLPCALVAFALLAVSQSFTLDLAALGTLGAGLGLIRPGTAAAASLSVRPQEQGAVAGLSGGISVIGNIFGPLLGTSLYELSPRAPYLLNAALMAVGIAFALLHPRVRARTLAL